MFFPFFQQIPLVKFLKLLFIYFQQSVLIQKYIRIFMKDNPSFMNHINIVAQTFQIRRNMGTDQNCSLPVFLHIFSEQIQNYFLSPSHPDLLSVHQEAETSLYASARKALSTLLSFRLKTLYRFIKRNIQLITQIQKTRLLKFGI